MAQGALPSRAFKDFDLTFRRNPITNDVNTLKNENAIKEAVKNIVRYNFYEKPFLPNYGGNVTGALFELYQSGQSATIEEQIKNCINLYEPRVVCYRVISKFNERDNDLQVEIYYLITGLPNVIDQLEVILKR
jgi:phage baseplate assembly protein W|nr:base plate wedge subunit [uncultured Mediterranean phage uvMED]|tara:strand:+ start:89 stop:487 length:399 start_codon:yes stop_codon:yes gene_type:complete